MPNSIAQRFHLRSEFESFRLDPRRNPAVLFGKDDRAIRERIRNGLRLASRSGDSEKYVVWGVAGRGKTQLARNLVYTIQKENLDLLPIYSKCESYSHKASATELYWDLLRGLTESSEDIAKVRGTVTEAWRKAKSDSSIRDRLHSAFGSDTTFDAIQKGLQAPNDDFVARTLRWMAGQEVDMTPVAGSVPSDITELAAIPQVIGGLTELVYLGSDKILTVILDEAERLDQVTSKDSDKEFGAGLREICSLRRLGLVILTIAKERDEMPVLLLRDEIKRRITVGNFIEEVLLGHSSVENFVNEYLRGVIEKGPTEQPVTLNDEHALALKTMVSAAGQSIDTYPFTAEAFQQFVGHIAGDPQISKPSEIITRVAKCASLADDQNKAFIDDKIINCVFESA